MEVRGRAFVTESPDDFPDSSRIGPSISRNSKGLETEARVGIGRLIAHYKVLITDSFGLLKLILEYFSEFH